MEKSYLQKNEHEKSQKCEAFHQDGAESAVLFPLPPRIFSVLNNYINFYKHRAPPVCHASCIMLSTGTDRRPVTELQKEKQKGVQQPCPVSLPRARPKVAPASVLSWALAYSADAQAPADARASKAGIWSVQAGGDSQASSGICFGLSGCWTTSEHPGSHAGPSGWVCVCACVCLCGDGARACLWTSALLFSYTHSDADEKHKEEHEIIRLLERGCTMGKRR